MRLEVEVRCLAFPSWLAPSTSHLPPSSARSWFFQANGRVNEALVPSFCLLSIQILPPCASTIPLEIASPSPAPWRSVREDCQLRSKTLGSCSGAIPLPLSTTDMTTPSGSLRATTTIFDPDGENLIALPTRFESV